MAALVSLATTTYVDMIYMSVFCCILVFTIFYFHFDRLPKEKDMALSQNIPMEKVTFNIPAELKEQVTALKNELQVSLSTICNEAIANYLQQKEREKWTKGVSMALEDKEYMELSQEMGTDNGDLYEY